MYLDEWNRKLYGESGWGAEEFWLELQLKSWPKFENECAYHIPAAWTEDVTVLVKTIQQELGDRITFQQIKEKYCDLVVYFSSKDTEAGDRARELIRECIANLINKGVHPPTTKD